MSKPTTTTDKDLVLGLGATGLSIARYLKRNDAKSQGRKAREKGEH